MQYKHSLQRYRIWYGKLIRCYPKHYHERFGEEMTQTFTDLYNERLRDKKGLFSFTLWIFLETSIEIIRKRITFSSMNYKSIIRIMLICALLLLIPLSAMLFTDEMNWDETDFIIVWILLCATGIGYKFITGKASSIVYRIAAAGTVATGLLLMWANLAVGLIGNENNPANLMYFGVIIVLIIGAITSRLEPGGMARALFATVTAQLLVPVIAMIIWKPSFDFGVVQVLGVNAFFAVLWTVPALLFRHASLTNLQNRM